MYLYHIVILALIQGLTEFLPVSSSGHLVLVHSIFDKDSCQSNWEENLIMDVAVHVGTLFSVLIYFWKDVLKMFKGLLDICSGRVNSDNARLLNCVVIGSIPVVIIGFLLHQWQPDVLRSIYMMIACTIFFGIVLWWVDAKKPSEKTLQNLTVKDSVFIGMFQALALIPGTSRSGITMTAARYLGYTRTESAHFSLLLAMIAISGAGTLGGIELYTTNNLSLTGDAILAIFLSFVSGLIAISLMMKFLQTATFKVFAIYRVLLGVVLLGLLYAGMVC